ncbi:uncharacterized protein LOC124161513 [Ischnura elegans]|uniref:uncharacterized protein LOC124161513 n=1 Tax=Ischnura elegans TaxID=197161 RepID=UPI001ED8AABC|nr:uncharacterized protein LOC124161513 [Ischnura elegans]
MMDLSLLREKNRDLELQLKSVERSKDKVIKQLTKDSNVLREVISVSGPKKGSKLPDACCSYSAAVSDSISKNEWSRQKGTLRGNRSSNKVLSPPPLPLDNRYELLSEFSEDSQSHHPATQRIVNPVKIPQHYKWRKRKKNTTLLYSDSHGRGLAAIMSEKFAGKEHEIVGVVKPNAGINDVTKCCEESSNSLTSSDNIVIMAGTNDIYLNKGKKVIDRIKSLVSKLSNTNVVIVNIPHRHDIPSDSCVNIETKRVNLELKKLCESLENVTVVDVNGFDRGLYTNHGLHLNGKGKNQLSALIVDCMGLKTGQDSNVKADVLVTAHAPETETTPSL